MAVHITSHFTFSFDEPSSALLQFEAAQLPEQKVLDVSCMVTKTHHFSRVAAGDDIGERIWINGNGRIQIDYEATVETNRIVYPLSNLNALPPHALPGETIKFLLDSRYCRSNEFQGLVSSEFEGTSGGARIDAIRKWIAEHFDYLPGASDASTDATDSFIKRQGICRDYTHVLVTMARASSIPARYVACYAPGVTPQDFHAIAEVFLADPSGRGGTWQLVDATGMADLANAVKIGVGRDAADVSFLTSFGPMTFHSSKVDVKLEA